MKKKKEAFSKYNLICIVWDPDSPQTDIWNTNPSWVKGSITDPVSSARIICTNVQSSTEVVSFV